MWLFALLLAVTPALAQQRPLPKTVPVHDPAGKVIGTATINGNSVYIRDTKGEHTYTLVVDPDGTKRMLDPHGKPLDWTVKSPK